MITRDAVNILIKSINDQQLTPRLTHLRTLLTPNNKPKDIEAVIRDVESYSAWQDGKDLDG